MDVKDGQWRLFVALPERRPLIETVDRWTQTPINADFPVAEYVAGQELAYKGAIVGRIFDYLESR